MCQYCGSRIIIFYSSWHIAFFERMELISLIRVMSTVLIINSFSLIQKTRLTKNVDFKTQTKASLISSMVSGLIGIGMALYGFGVWCLVGQQLSRQFLDTLFLWIFTKWYPKIQFSMKFIQGVIRIRMEIVGIRAYKYYLE